MTTYNAISKTAQNIARFNGVGYSHSGLISASGPQLSSPDWSFTDDFSGSRNTSIYTKSTFTTYGFNDNGNTVLSANYAPEGITAGYHADSEQEITLPINAVQVLLKFREFIPASYTSANCGNQKTVGFWSGAYGTIYANISVTSECWPVNGNGIPSIYTGNDGVNYGHFQIPNNAGTPLWLAGDGNWHKTWALIELAQSPGDFGRYRIWRDGNVIVDSNNTAYDSYMPDVSCRDTLHYSSRGNFIDKVRMFGWCNVKSGSETAAFAGTVHFLYDDLEIYANATHKTIAGV